MSTSAAQAASPTQWKDMSGLDRRISKALAKLGFVSPTNVQSQCIPLALLGKDVLLKARTGSGKTVAFAVPLLQRVLALREADPSAKDYVKCLVLVPTKELCKQAEKVLQDLTYYCREAVTVSTIDGDIAHMQRKHNWNNKADVIISTPGSLVQQVEERTVVLNKVKCLVIDEADLVLSFGYNDDMLNITAKMPKIYQGIMVSATLSAELDKLSKSMLHSPVLLDVKEELSASHKLQQFYLQTSEDEKFLVLFVFLKLGLLKGKGLIFVRDVNKCYRLKLFLQQFFLSAAVISAEVPFNSRIHMVQEFNQGVFDYLIATDKSFVNAADAQKASEGEDDGAAEEEEEVEGAVPLLSGGSDSESDSNDDEGNDSSDDDDCKDERDAASEGGIGTLNMPKTDKLTSISAQKKKGSKEDEDFGVSRGIDFVGISFVINFDFPETVESYAHRIGRTARSTAFGTSLSFVTPNEAQILHDVRQNQPHIFEGDQMSVLNALSAPLADQFDPVAVEEHRKQPRALSINTKELEGFRYRVEDTLRSVSDTAVREFRTAELKREILHSATLKDYFARNPNDLKILHHDKSVSHPIQRKEHLHNVPKYLIPASMRGVAGAGSNKKTKKRKREGGAAADKRIANAKSRDPLSDASAVKASEEGENNNVQEIFEAEGGPTFALRKGDSTSGRKAWQQNHKKGDFNKNKAKKNAHRVAGTFTKSKRMK